MAERSEAMDEKHLNEAQDNHPEKDGDSLADALAAVALIAIFVFTCIYWISGQ